MNKTPTPHPHFFPILNGDAFLALACKVSYVPSCNLVSITLKRLLHDVLIIAILFGQVVPPVVLDPA